MRYCLYLLFLILGSSLQAAEIGDPAPDFSLKDLNGKTHSLADYADRIVVLEWTHRDCPFNERCYESGDIQKMQESVQKAGGVWLSIATGRTARDRVLPENSKADATLLDQDGTVARAYQALTTSHAFVISPEGSIVYSGAPDSNSALFPPKGQPVTQYVLEAVKDIRNGKPVRTPITKPYGCSVRFLN